MPKLLAIIILAKNEEHNLPRCLRSISPLEADVFVIDSGSTDRTAEIATRNGATLLQHVWKNYSDQMNWAIDNLVTDAPWTCRLDADEYLTDELCAELSECLPKLPISCTGALVKRRFMFLGKWMKRGGMYPIWHLRFWRTGVARCEERWMDEHMQLGHGEVIRLKYDLVDDNSKSLTFWIEKHNHYASRELLDMYDSEQGSRSHGLLVDQAAKKRWVKESLYGKAPLFARAFAYGFYRYFLRGGFLDGREGLVFHFLQAVWYRFLVDAKILEIDIQKGKQRNLAANYAEPGETCIL